jgi:hypothetical protein
VEFAPRRATRPTVCLLVTSGSIYVNADILSRWAEPSKLWGGIPIRSQAVEPKQMQRSFVSTLRILLSVSLGGTPLSSYQRTPPDLVKGGIYSVRATKNRFAIVKILVLEPGVVHVGIYKGTFDQRPARVETTSLTVGKLGDSNPGMGHIPIDKKEFLSWDPELLLRQAVTPYELEGYQLWENAHGGSFKTL